MNMRWLLTLFLTVTLLVGCKTAPQVLRDENEVYISMLHGVGYSQLFRSSLRPGCRTDIRVSAEPICIQLEVIPDEYIERVALPYFKLYVSSENARIASDFYNSPPGKRISYSLN